MLVGIAGNAFPVVANENGTIDELKNAIKMVKYNTIQYEADELNLYLAKKDNKWLAYNSPEFNALENGDVSYVTDLLNTELVPMEKICNVFTNLNDDDEVIHILIKLPTVKLDSETTDIDGNIRNPNRLKRWREINEILDNNKRNKKIKLDNGISTRYSYANWESLKNTFKLERYNQPIESISDEQVKPLHDYFKQLFSCFQLVETENEAKRLHFISPILVCVCSLFDGDVEILIEENVEGKNVHVCGRCDFVIQHGDKRICVVEAKNDDFGKGFAQDLLGCEAFVDIENLDMVYGIVTNFVQWNFIKNSNEKIECDIATIQLINHIPTYESIKYIAEKIYGMLSN